MGFWVLPWATFTDPELARVGLSEDQARRQDVAYQVIRFDAGELDRAITGEAARCFVKVLSRKPTGLSRTGGGRRTA